MAPRLNRALAGAGIYASRLETGTTLEGLFLELTGSAPGRDRCGNARGRRDVRTGGDRVAVMRLLVANLRKLVRRPASWVTLVLLLALLALIFVALIAAARTSPEPEAALGARLFVTFPGAYELVLTMILASAGCSP